MILLNKLLSLLPFREKKLESEYFFALNVGSEIVEGAVWGIEDKKLVIVKTAVAPLGGDLVKASNIALDLALADFEPEPAKVLFGVPDSWLQDDNLKESHLKILRELVKELDIKPMAYVSSSHSIAHFLQKLQGVPVTAVLVENSEPLNITVAKAGKIISTKSVKRGGSIAEDIEKGLMAFSEVEVLPSKILIYGADTKKESEKLKDELNSYPWMQNLPFLHLPKIEILKDATAICAVAFAGACEFEPNVSVKEDVLEKASSVQVDPVVASDMGRAGFISGDIENIKQVESTYLEDELPVEIDGSEVSPKVEEKNLHLSKNGQFFLAPIFSILGKVHIFKKRRFGFFRNSLFIPLILLLILAAMYVLLPKAQVTVFIDPKILEKEAQVIADPAVKEIDEVNNKIPGKTVTVTSSGSEKGAATGKKLIGDPARGTVNIYNLTASKVSLSQGTILSGSNGLKFELDSTVQIASQSSTVGADFTTVTTPGKATTGITAQLIGPESNLAPGVSLTVASYSQSQVAAKVDSALSGGTSKEVTIVTSDDQKRLLALGIANLRKKAKEQIQAQLTGDQKILEEGLSEANVSSRYSKKINDQAQEFNLDLSVTYKGTAYSDIDLKTMVSKLVQTNVPEGYLLNLQDAETQSDIAKVEKDGKVIFLAKFRAKLMPKLDLDKIKNQIRGKTPQQVASNLKNIENVISSEIKITPSLPLFLNRLPLLLRNISLDVKLK